MLLVGLTDWLTSVECGQFASLNALAECSLPVRVSVICQPMVPCSLHPGADAETCLAYQQWHAPQPKPPKKLTLGIAAQGAIIF